MMGLDKERDELQREQYRRSQYRRLGRAAAQLSYTTDSFDGDSSSVGTVAFQARDVIRAMRDVFGDEAITAWMDQDAELVLGIQGEENYP